MELTLDQALQKGIEAHKAGKVQEADRYYTAILQANPKHPDANHNMGVLAIGVGKVEEALPFYKIALEVKPNIAQYWLSYVDALIKLDQIDEARTTLEQARSIGVKADGLDQIEKKLEERLGSAPSISSNTQEPPREQLQSLINLYTQGQYKEVQTQASQILKQFPKSINLYNIIGGTFKKLGRLNEAIEAYNKALSIEPDYAEAYNNMGNAFKDQGKLKKALEAYNKAIAIKPDLSEAYNNKGNALRKQAKLDQAIEAYNKALTIKPAYSDAYNNMGITLKEQGKLEEALEAYNKAISINPNFAEAYNNKGNALHEQSKLDQAIESYNKALTIKPAYSQAYNNMGTAFIDKGKLEKAMNAYERALSIKPDYAEVHRNLSSIKKYSLKDAHFLQVQDFYTKDNLSDDQRCSLSFTLAKMYEDVGELKKAFEFLTEGNSLRKKLLNYTIEQDINLFGKVKVTQPHLLKNSLEITEVSPKHSPIFILGMPRSGTSLVEQIISSHSQVTGVGELDYVFHYGLQLSTDSRFINKENISDFKDKYLSRLLKMSNGRSFITDKMPQNFLFIPLICAAFPEAKIIHVKRDAAAICWSNYKQYFLSKELGYCYDLHDVKAYYRLYTELMKLWLISYRDRIYDLNYEKLTTDQENQIRKVINHLGLKWEDACLSPHRNKRSVRTASQQQVRKKVYQGSSESWRKYELYLEGAFDNLTS